MMAASCLSTERASCEFIKLLNVTPLGAKSYLRTDGAYHMIKPPYRIGVDFKNGVPGKIITKPFLHAPFFFFEDGTVFHQQWIVLDSVGYRSVKFKPYSKLSFGDWGVYTISHDTVHAIIYITYDQKSRITPRRMLMSHFKGIARSDGTIENWRMVDPFPADALEYHVNDAFLDRLEEPSTLFFKAAPSAQWIDPNRAWIQELGKQKDCK